MPGERLQRALARAGYGSRRSSEELIAAGRIKLNGRVATIGDKVDPATDEVELDGTRVNLDPNVRYYALHKPPGVVTTMRDPQGRPSVRDRSRRCRSRGSTNGGAPRSSTSRALSPSPSPAPFPFETSSSCCSAARPSASSSTPGCEGRSPAS